MSKDRMGLGAVDVLHECDGCESTLLCSPKELKGWGWKSHSGTKGKNKWTLLLCDTCEARSADKAKA